MKTTRISLLVGVAIAWSAPTGLAQCGGQWLRTTDEAGLRGQSRVHAVAVLDTAPFDTLVLGGQLNQIIDGVQYFSVVGNDGLRWVPFGSLPRSVNSLLSNIGLYAGIDYEPGPEQPLSTVLRWQGSDWVPLGTLNGATHALTRFNGALYAGGDFTLADGQPVQHIARWSGVAWEPLTGGGTDSPVRALTVYNGRLIAGGDFSLAGGAPAANIAQWDGVSWSPLGSGTNGLVRALTTHGTDLVAAGHFTQAGGQSALRIARWSGSSWSAYGSGFNNRVWAVQTINGDLHAGGQFTASAGQPLSRIARWNAATSLWEPLDAGMDDIVAALGEFENAVVAGGYFDHADGLAVRAVAQFWASSWEALGGGFRGFSPGGYGSRGIVKSLATVDGQPRAGGGFSAADGRSAHSLAVWNGLDWQEITGGAQREGRLGRVAALGAIDRGGIPPSTLLIVGGRFDRVGGDRGERFSVEAANIAVYSRVFGNPDWDALGAGLPDGWVSAVAAYDGQIYAGGNYVDSDGYAQQGFLARWDGVHWTDLGHFRDGSTGDVWALREFDGRLCIGGRFDEINGQPVSYNTAQWNGSTFQSMGAGLAGREVKALALHGGGLVAGGDFGISGDLEVANIARWNGNAWTPLGDGIPHSSGTPTYVNALAVYNGSIIAGGYFSQAGTQACRNIARWNGVVWQPLGPGLNDQVEALCVSDGELYAGGNFTRAGGIVAHRWARWTDTNIPWIAIQPLSQSQTQPCGGAFSASVTVAMGYDSVTYRWRRNGVRLTDGVSASGSTISGADSPQLTITNLRGGDPGSYTVLVSNACGSVISRPVVLAVRGVCVGDLNVDGQVDLSDLAFELSNFGCTGDCEPLHGDLDEDGQVTVADVATLLANLGTVFP